MRFGSPATKFLLRAVPLACAMLICGSAAHAQARTSSHPLGSINFGGAGDSTPNGPTTRSLDGVVRDAADKPAGGALVQLKDLKTGKTMSVLADSEGKYRFVNLGTNVDYEFWAQTKEKKSDTKKISSFDSTQPLVRNLQIK